MTTPSRARPMGETADESTLTREERDRVGAFLDRITYQGPPPLNGNGYHGITREQYSESYQCWWRGGRGWHALHQGGTGQMAALCWYQHVHRPGSHEWRPAVIIRALLEVSGTPTERPTDG